MTLSVLLSTIGGVGIWSVVVALPAVQTEFGTDRASAALPYALSTLGIAAGNVAMGRLVDRFGIAPLLMTAGLTLCLGYVVASRADSLTVFTLAYMGPIAFLGSAVTFGPLLADVSHWFLRRRGLAISICAAGNYLAGTVWPPLLEYGIQAHGWRQTHFFVGILCALVIVPMAFLLRRRPPPAPIPSAALVGGRNGFARLSPCTAQVLLCVGGVSCCVAMAMPQVHLVAYCGDLGYGPVHGARMLSLMLGLGVISRIGFGFVADGIGGLRTLLLGSTLQMLALLLYFNFISLGSLYVISALFGLFQSGIVPSYAIIIREHFPAREAGRRIGMTLTATLAGMAIGGWMSGAIFDVAGSYRAAFANAVAWNALNLSIALFLVSRAPGPATAAS